MMEVAGLCMLCGWEGLQSWRCIKHLFSPLHMTGYFGGTLCESEFSRWWLVWGNHCLKGRWSPLCFPVSPLCVTVCHCVSQSLHCVSLCVTVCLPAGFWLVWAIILILSCCCVCHHRRTKHRLQQQQRQHEINLIAYREAHSYASVPFYFRFLPNYLLPDYEEVVNRPPTPPPPYSVSHTGTCAVVSPLTSDPQDGMGHCLTIQTAPVAAVSDTLPPRSSLEEPQRFGTPNIGFNRHKAAYMQEEPADGGLGPQEASTEGPVSPAKNFKEPLLLRDLGPDAESAGQEDKDKGAPGRRRRFTGDSGIEVCVCGRGGNTGGGREMESLLGEEDEEDDEGNFCDGCAHRSAEVPGEEPAPALKDPGGRTGCLLESGSPSLPPPTTTQPPHPAVCLLTINEREGPPHPGAEPQG